MGGFIVRCDGQMVTMPFEGNWMVSTLEGRFPNDVMITMDEDRFQTGFVEKAVWTHGKGPFASLSYCGGELTIQRYEKFGDAVDAKRAIDGGGCGGGCCKVHILVRADADNPRAAKEQSNVREYIKKNATND